MRCIAMLSGYVVVKGILQEASSLDRRFNISCEGCWLGCQRTGVSLTTLLTKVYTNMVPSKCIGANLKHHCMTFDVVKYSRSVFECGFTCSYHACCSILTR